MMNLFLLNAKFLRLLLNYKTVYETQIKHQVPIKTIL